ncbi:aspartate/glutamate racemase family protein [Paraburkholderia megapolitana]|uniref:aspartate/glutamate racemase family protein n=1 Tax=Paraburkholderia TaxID=1822464 RepID=UPI0027DFF5E0|nr:aspartate/glutamate racemase family protein [Paraburkholderia megapolitana]
MELRVYPEVSFTSKVYYALIRYNLMASSAMSRASRITLIHATAVAMPPIAESFRRLWKEAVVYNLLDDALTPDLECHGGDVNAMAPRFTELAQYAARGGSHGVLFTCSAFGPAVEAARMAVDIPLLKPNEAMIEEAAGYGQTIGLVATFEPALAPITAEFLEYAKESGVTLEVQPYLAAGAWEAIQNGDKDAHDRLVAQTCAKASACDVICFAQFSMTTAQESSQQASGKRVLTTPDSAVRKLKALLS